MSNTVVAAVVGILIGIGSGYVFFKAPASSEHMVEMNSSKHASEEGHAAMAHGMVEVSSENPLPTISLEVTKDSKDGYNLHIVTNNFTFTPETVGGVAVANKGHAHLYVNGTKVARVYGAWFNLSSAALKDGENTIEVTLNADDHSEWAHGGEHIAATATVTK